MADAEREQRVVRDVDTGLRIAGEARAASSGRTFGVDEYLETRYVAVSF